MANEKTTEKVNETVTEAPKAKTETIATPTEESKFDSIFDVDDIEDVEEDEGAVSFFRDNSGRVYSDCGSLKRERGSRADDGYQYHNYYVKFNTLINGKPFVQQLYFTLKESFRPKHEMLDEFYGAEKAKPLFISRSEVVTIRKNGKETVRVVYTPQLRFKDDYGSPIVFDLKANSSNTFNTFIEILKVAGRVE